MILDNGVTVLCCTPTYAIRLAEVAAAEKIDLSAGHVRAILVAGEVGGSIMATRARIQSLWPGARVSDHHGMTEVGPVTYECPARPGVLHVIESAYYAEVIDTITEKPVPPGQTGELILTTLGRTGSPSLRYRTGDLVKPGTRDPECGIPCACGRFDMALEGGILGRTDDMIIVRGVNVYPAAVEEIIRSSEEVIEYCAHVSQQNALTELRVEIELVTGCTDGQAVAAHLEKRFQDTLALRVPVTVASPGALPRFEMKSQRWTKS
jgi:phenylacetate-CoA ligase